MNSADAFADPLRLSILKRLGEAGTADVDELARATGAHANTVRHHLRALKRAGVVLTSKGGSPGPGRPRLHYRVAPGWSLPGDGLAPLLAALLQGCRPDPADLRRMAREWGASADRRRSLASFLEHLGFLAREERKALKVSACPCPLVSPSNPAWVCGLMVAAAEGFLEGGPRIRSSTHDPLRRECTLAF
ncbi:MAG: helix-turn-helix transcriptional regulator [Planctomycetaceae bacterium]|nr:helix-turn-helix transcriptional regulator [Planctomycetaceae bacterium]